MGKTKLNFNEWLLTEYFMDEEDFSKCSKQDRSAIKKHYNDYLNEE